MNVKLKLALMASGMVLGASGAAFAATGHVPAAVSGGLAALTGSSSGTGSQGTATTATGSRYGSDDGGAAGDQYAPGTHGGNGNVESEHDAAMNQYGGDDGVSETARDKDAMGTKTLPNGNEVENHGMAVSGAAHEQGDGDATPPATPTIPAPPATGSHDPQGGDDATPPAGGAASHMSSDGSSHMGDHR